MCLLQIIKKLVIIDLFLHIACLKQNVSINKRFFGIELEPYLRSDELYYITHSYNTNSLDKLRTLLKVVSSRFSRVFIESVDAHDVPFVANDTYYRHTFARARTAEIAAEVNRARNKKILTVLIGLDLSPWLSIQRINTEFNVAMEAFQVAHSIYPGTVEGLMLSNPGLVLNQNSLNHVKILREAAIYYNFRIGTRHNCFNIHSTNYTHHFFNISETHYMLTTNIIRYSDFFMCDIMLVARAGQDFDVIFKYVSELILKIKSINENVGFMFHTGFLRSNKTNTSEEKDNLKLYALKLDEFATLNNVTVFLKEAFESLTGENVAWWKLTELELINNVSGYVEIISDTRVFEHKAVTKANTILQSSNIESNPTHKINIWIIFVLVVGFSVVLIGIIYALFKRPRFSCCFILSRNEIEEFFSGSVEANELSRTNALHDNSKTFLNMEPLEEQYNKLLELHFEDLEIYDEIIDGGEVGCVRKALVRNTSHGFKEVALKLSTSYGGTSQVRQLLSEINILSYLETHANIVPIIGAITSDLRYGKVYLATELCPLGSLKKLLKEYRQARKSSVPLNEMIRWSYEIACGMEYLECKRVIHTNLNSRSVLLSSDGVARITDLGAFSRLGPNVLDSPTTLQRSWRWMAFESLQVADFSTKSDVWSYGVVLWEIFSLGAQPYTAISYSRDFLEALESGLRLNKPNFATSEIHDVMTSCWKLERNARPSFAELKQSFLHIA